jgi:hypothetical protein
MTGSENGDIATPITGTSPAARSCNPEMASSTCRRRAQSATRGSTRPAIWLAWLTIGGPALGGPSSKKRVSPPQASISMAA